MIAGNEDDFLPPTEFIVSIILPGLSSSHGLSAIKSANLVCSTCWRSSYNFSCPKCVIDTGKLAEKKKRLEELTLRRKLLVEKIENRLNNFSDRCDLELKKLQLEKESKRLRTSFTLRQESLKSKRTRVRECKKLTEEKRHVISDLNQSLATFEKWYLNISKSVNLHAEEFNKRRKHLRTVRQQTSADLFETIFTLDTVTVTSASPNDCADKNSLITLNSEASSSIEIVDALTEATLTNYYHDRWIFMGRHSEIQYRFVHSCTIGDFGDYVPLTGWLFSRQRDVPMTDSLFSNKSALGALSALAYLTQTTSVLSRIFDITLPFYLIFVEFYDEKLDEDEFETLNLKVNYNVAYLCHSQGLRDDCVSFGRPFWNMLNFLNNLENVCVDGERAFTINLGIIRDFQRAANQITWKETKFASAVPIEQNNDDWENVSEQLPEWTSTTVAGTSPPTFTQFFTSATTSVANLFKNVHG